MTKHAYLFEQHPIDPIVIAPPAGEDDRLSGIQVVECDLVEITLVPLDCPNLPITLH